MYFGDDDSEKNASSYASMNLSTSTKKTNGNYKDSIEIDNKKEIFYAANQNAGYDNALIVNSQYMTNGYYPEIDTNFYEEQNDGSNIDINDFTNLNEDQINQKKEGSMLNNFDYKMNTNQIAVQNYESNKRREANGDSMNLDFNGEIQNQEISKRNLYNLDEKREMNDKIVDHEKMINEGKYYLRNNDYFYKDQYFMQAKTNREEIYQVRNQPNDQYYVHNKGYDEAMNPNFNTQHYEYRNRQISNDYYPDHGYLGKVNDQYVNNYGEYYANYEHNDNHISNNESSRPNYHDSNEKIPMDRESYFDSFHQTPHGELKNTYYNPFVIKHRRRTSKMQLRVLEKTFETNVRPDAALRKILGDQLGMTSRSVQVWFQNRRAKIKKNKKKDDDKTRPMSRTESIQRDHTDSNFYNHGNSMYFSPISPQEGLPINSEETSEQREKNMYDSSGLKEHGSFKNSNFLNH